MPLWTRRQAFSGLAFAIEMTTKRTSVKPAGYIDAHVHVWRPASPHFPHDPLYNGPVEMPLDFPPETLLTHAQPAGVKRIVLVQMSFYGTDNSYMLDAMRRYPGVFSGIAVVDHEAATAAAEMERLRRLGVRGFRITLGNRPVGWLETNAMRHFWQLAAERKMAICPLIGPAALPAIDRMCTAFPNTTVVIDHMARIGMMGPVSEQDVKALCALSRHPKTHVKVSAFYALGKKKAPFTDLAPVVHSLYQAYGPQRLMWGSDSPYQVQPPYTYMESLDFVREGLPFLSSADKEWMLRRSAESIFF